SAFIPPCRVGKRVGIKRDWILDLARLPTRPTTCAKVTRWAKSRTVVSVERYLRSRFCPPYDSSPLDQRAVIKPAVEPILISRYVLLHRDIDVGLIERNARNVGEGKLDEAFDRLFVVCLVAFRGSVHGGVDERVHRFRLVAHGVEDRILAVIAPDKE